MPIFSLKNGQKREAMPSVENFCILSLWRSPPPSLCAIPAAMNFRSGRANALSAVNGILWLKSPISQKHPKQNQNEP